MRSFKIKDFEVGFGKTFIVAELSANHNHDFEIAVKTIKAAKKAGADAIKLQTYTPDTLTINVNNDYFKINKNTLWDGQTLYELYKEAYTPWEWQPKLKKVADDIGLICFSTPFDKTAVDFLEKLQMPAFKIASFEINDISLIEYIASKGKPVILSTGIAALNDIEDALTTIRKTGNENIALLKCTSAYPAPYEEANLKTIADMSERFNVIPGLSDHTLGTSVAIASVALGAKIIEKHFILNRKLGGPDSEFSIEPDEFKFMVKSIREVEKAIGEVNYEISEKVEKNRIFARSLFIVEDIKKGEEFTEKNIRSIRPGYGLPPKHIKEIIGQKAKDNYEKGTPLNWNMIE
ncbi:MAG: pseudaminic acid synthase [Ignavibacteriae bacterium]|nr:pseudaminic acid synthase [Ignavibacteriota bacterium]